ncbi:MAG: LCP family protein [Meiothermus sp.]|uniref:LCP family protein n=1 Tax=Meiothermus sp. TaxID=1955249 RepID=UPI0025E81DCD|nr:LCP family protein [Meiothermus sp.]MCS7194800.1 LCP family protein [Meiothermus sp.]MDW8481168.1 LCP family protein [Meiothermus sp.]
MVPARLKTPTPRLSFLLLGLSLLLLAGALVYGSHPQAAQGGPGPAFSQELPKQLSLVVAARDTEYCGYHTPCGPGRRTDTIFYLRLQGAEATLVAIPRDLRYRGETPSGPFFGRINAVYERAGPEGLRWAVQDVLGVPVQHYLILTFEAVMRLVDAVDGVEVELPYPMRYTDRAAGLYIDFPAGRLHLDGKDAVKYMRFRRWEGADLGRIDRIKEVLQQVAQKAQSPRYWPRLPGVAASLWGSLETNLSLTQVLELLPGLRGVVLRSATLPTLEEGPYLVPDPVAMPAFTSALLGYRTDAEAIARLVQAEALGLRVLLLDRSGVGLGERFRQGFLELGLSPPEVRLAEPGGRSQVLVQSGVSSSGRESSALMLAKDLADLMHLPLQTRLRLEPAGYSVVVVLGPDYASR